MSIKNIDFAVVGGGISASIASMELTRHGYSVVQYLGTPTSNIDPPEILGPIAIQRLEQFGISMTTDISWPCNGVLSLWGTKQPEYSDYSLFSANTPCSVYPHVIKRKLATIAGRLGVTQVYQNAVIDGEGVVSSKGTDETPVSTTQKWTLVGTGRSSKFGPFKKETRVKHNSRIAYSFNWTKTDRLSDLVIEIENDGWWYAPPSAGDKDKLVYITDYDCFPVGRAKREETLLKKFLETNLVKSIGNLNPVLEISGVDAHMGYAKSPVIGNCVAIGDLAYSTDPASGSGLLYAIETGWLAASQIIQDVTDFEDYYDLLNKVRKSDYSAAAYEFSRVANQFPNSAFWGQYSKSPSYSHPD